MTKFKVKTTFFIKPKNYFVIAGEIIEGVVNKDMFFIYERLEGSESIILPIKDVSVIDRRVNGSVVSETSLCIEANVLLAAAFNTLEFQGRIFNIEKDK